MTTQLESSIVRIRAANGRTIGAGFLVGEKQVLTCAHVVAGALGLPHDTPETPQAEVCLDFPLIKPGRVVTARVIHWQLPPPDGDAKYPLLERFLTGQGTLPAVAKSGRSF